MKYIFLVSVYLGLTVMNLIKKTVRLKFINFCNYQFQFRPDATLVIVLNMIERELLKLCVVTCSKNIKFSVRTSFFLGGGVK
jgi:hypothetical protein